MCGSRLISMMSAESRIVWTEPRWLRSLALHLAQRTVALKIGQKLHAIIGIQPDAQFIRVVTDNSVMAKPDPPHERIVSLDEFCVTQPRNRDQHRAGVKGCAKTRLTLSQPRLALPQFLFGALAHGDVVADGLNKLSTAELDGRKKHFNRNFSTVPAQHHPFETRTAVG